MEKQKENRQIEALPKDEEASKSLEQLRSSVSRKKLSEEIETKKIDLDQLVTDFPKDFPGVGEVERFPVKDAKKCVVMMGKLHQVVEFLSKVDSLPEPVRKRLKPVVDELNRVIESSNADNEKTISEFIKQYKIGSLYLEGETPLSINELRREIESYRKMKKENPNDPRLKIEKEALLYTLGGAFDLVIEGKIGVEPAETEEAQRRVRQSRNKNDSELNEFREDSFLKLISKSPDHIVLTSWGNAHTLNDRNLSEWNSNHPDEKISGLKLVPSTTKKIGNFEVYVKRLLTDALKKE